jgi:hypothetical protein
MLTVTWSELIRAGLCLAALTATTTATLMLLPGAATRRGWLLPLMALLDTLAAVAWLFEDKHVEGHVFFRVTASHGLTASDLLAIAPLLAASASLVMWRRRRRPYYARRPGYR